MSVELSPAETNKRDIECMGQELGTLYNLLWNEVAWLSSKWCEYVELFGTKPSRIELMNQASGHFFRVVQDSLWEDSLLHIARLTDPPSSAGKSNLTIRRLPDCIDEPVIKANVQSLINIAIEKSGFCRDWRNRHIAHKDLRLAMKNGAEPLMAASRLKVKEAIASLADTLNAVSLHYLDSTTSFEVAGGSNGALSLLYLIDDGLRRRQEVKGRFEAGECRQEDYRPREI